MSSIHGDPAEARFAPHAGSGRPSAQERDFKMSVIRNIPIARKFSLAFGLVCILCVTLGTYSFFTFRTISASSVDVSENGFPAVVTLSNARGAFNRLGRADLNLLLCQTPSCSAQQSSLRQKAINDYETALKLYEPTISYPGEREVYQRVTAGIARYRDVSDRTVALLAAAKTGDALDTLTSASAVAAFDDTATDLTENLNLSVKYGTESSKHATSVSSRAIWINLAVTILIVGLCALIGATLTRVIAPRIGRATAALERLAAKDLTTHMRVSGTDEIGRLGDALNTSVSSMREVLLSVAQGVETLSAATTQMSARSVQTAGNANIQSSRTNQIAAAAQEMTATIGEISHNAEGAAGSSRISAETADQIGRAHV